MATPMREQYPGNGPGEKFQDEAGLSDDHQDDGSSVGSSDYQSSQSGTSSQFTDTNTNANDNKSESSSDGISKEGRAAVLGSKMLVLFVLALAAASVGIATYMTTSKSEENIFKEQVGAVGVLRDSCFVAIERTALMYMIVDISSQRPLLL